MDPLPQTEEEWMFHGILCGDPIATFKLSGRTGRGLTAQLELGVDLLIGYIAHKKRETPGIPESGCQAIEQGPGGFVDGGAQSLLRLGVRGDSGEKPHAQ